MLSESAAVLTYLAQKYPQANKYFPKDIKSRYLVSKALDFSGNTFRPAFVGLMQFYFKFNGNIDDETLETIRNEWHPKTLKAL